VEAAIAAMKLGSGHRHGAPVAPLPRAANGSFEPKQTGPVSGVLSTKGRGSWRPRLPGSAVELEEADLEHSSGDGEPLFRECVPVYGCRQSLAKRGRAIEFAD
jgi:hypothetical protein